MHIGNNTSLVCAFYKFEMQWQVGKCWLELRHFIKDTNVSVARSDKLLEIH